MEILFDAWWVKRVVISTFLIQIEAILLKRAIKCLLLDVSNFCLIYYCYWWKKQFHILVFLNTSLGELEGVEKARARVRELTPLIFYFDLPIMTSLQDSAVDTNDPFLKTVQDQYNVQVLIIGIKWFRIRSKIYK